MTVLTTIAKAGPYAGAGTTGPFTVPFRFLDASHLRVIRTLGLVETVLVLGTDYTVTGVGLSTGTVTLTDPLPVGQTLTVVRNVPATQDADYVAGDAFPAESHEEALDKLTMLVQQNSEELARSAKLPASSTADADALSAALLRVDANEANINAVANNEANINAVASNGTDISTVAENVVDVKNFSDVYLGAKSAAPSLRNNGSALQSGDLYFDLVLGDMRVFNGSTWQFAGSLVNGTSIRQTFTATAGQTSFTVTGGYDAGFADVYLNGVKLVNGVDVDVSSGTAVVLTVGAALNDVVDVVAYGAFVLADTYTQAQVNGLLAARVAAASGVASRLTLNDGYTEEVFAITDGTTVNLDPNNGSIQTWTLGANRTPGQASWAAGQSITLMVDDGSARTITWTTLGVVWKTGGGTAPTLQTTGFTVIALWKVGTTIYGARVGDA
jgi:hypothetical protein